MKLNAVHSAAPTRAFGELAARLDDVGCDGLYLADLTHDALLGAAVAANASRRMAIGTAIALAFTRSPTALAYAAHDLGAASEGRFTLGIGPQVKPHIERRFGLAWSEPVKRMRETVLAMRAVWAAWQDGGALDYRGEIFRLSLMPPAFRPEPTPWGGPPIYLAAVGPKMAELAGEVADGLVLHAFTTPGYVRAVVLPAIMRGLATSGRRREDFQLFYPAFIADTTAAKTRDEARAQARNSVAFYASTPAYRGVLEQHGLGDLQPRLQQMTHEGAWTKMANEIGDEVLDLFCTTGTPGELAESFVARWGGVADQISLGADFWQRHAEDREWQDAAGKLRG